MTWLVSWRLALAATYVLVMVKDPNGWFATASICFMYSALILPPPENTNTTIEKETIHE